MADDHASRDSIETAIRDVNDLISEIGANRIVVSREMQALNQEVDQLKVSNQNLCSDLQGSQLSISQLSEEISRGQQEVEQLKAHNERLSSDLQDAREKSELILSQLHQAQEELEHYFLKSEKGVQRAKFLAQKIDQRDSLLSQYAETIEKLKRLYLDAVRRDNLWRRLMALVRGNRKKVA